MTGFNRIAFILVTTSLLALPGMSWAQHASSASPPPQPPSISPDQVRAYSEVNLSGHTLDQDLWLLQLQRYAATQPPARQARAQRVSAMIDQGDCKGAAKLAVDEGDARMAGRVHDICDAKRGPGA